MPDCQHPQVSTITRLSGPPLTRCMLCGAILNADVEGRSSILGGQVASTN